jgi:hypothetical protein
VHNLASGRTLHSCIHRHSEGALCFQPFFSWSSFSLGGNDSFFTIRLGGNGRFNLRSRDWGAWHGNFDVETGKAAASTCSEFSIYILERPIVVVKLNLIHPAQFREIVLVLFVIFLEFPCVRRARGKRWRDIADFKMHHQRRDFQKRILKVRKYIFKVSTHRSCNAGNSTNIRHPPPPPRPHPIR